MSNQDIKVTLAPNATIKTTLAPTTEIKVTVLASGPRGAMGPPALTYTHTQSIASNVWVITHNLEKFPSITIVDSSGNVVMGDIRYVDNLTIQVSFSGAFSGRAYLN